MEAGRAVVCWALWKGLLPTYQRQAVWNFLFWVLLEEAQKRLGLERL